MTDKTPAEEVLCPVALTLSLIGGKWKALILWNLLEGTMRYSALRKAVPDATPKMLTRSFANSRRTVSSRAPSGPSFRLVSTTRSRPRARASNPFSRPCTAGATPIWRKETGSPAAR